MVLKLHSFPKRQLETNLDERQYTRRNKIQRTTSISLQALKIDSYPSIAKLRLLSLANLLRMFVCVCVTNSSDFQLQPAI